MPEHRLVVDIGLTAEDSIHLVLLQAKLPESLQRSLLMVLADLRDLHAGERGEALSGPGRGVTGKGDDVVLDRGGIVLGEGLRVSPGWPLRWRAGGLR